MSEHDIRHWDKLVRKYAVGHRSGMDVSLAVASLIEKLGDKLPVVRSGCDVFSNFQSAPMEYIYVYNKVTGPDRNEQYRFNALTECEITFYQNNDNTLRFRYFIQMTHGQMIHGLSWVKSSADVPFTDSDFRQVLNFVREKFLSAESEADCSPQKATYGIWQGRNNRLGLMHNYVVKDFCGDCRVMDEEAIEKMCALLTDAYKFFKANKQEITNSINKSNQQ